MNEQQVFTDKFLNGLDKMYERILTPYKDKHISLFEIGIAEGGSLLMFERLLPDAKIYGIDILPRPESLKDSKIETRVIDQNNIQAIEALANEAGDFDVIIDDGCHFGNETRKCFDTLWKHLRKGGSYVIEDWVVSIKTKEDNVNFEYMNATQGMDKLVLEIASRKTELGITSIEIIVKENWMSYAVFKK
jgi:SAM-dependent methyltransferase